MTLWSIAACVYACDVLRTSGGAWTEGGGGGAVCLHGECFGIWKFSLNLNSKSVTVAAGPLSCQRRGVGLPLWVLGSKLFKKGFP